MGKKISIISLFILISFSLIFCAVYNVSTPAEFQNALNSAAASSEDDIIQVSTGIYDFSETATYKTNGGSGKLTIIGGSSSPEDTSFSVKHGVNKLIVINTDQDNNGGDNSDDIVIKNILFKNAPVKIYGSEANITVYNCYFWYLSQLFISSDSGYVDIENSYFFHNSTSIRLNKTPNVFIANNIIYDNDWGIYGYFSGSTRIKIINNLICDSSNFGVDFWNDFYPHKNNKENALFEIYNNIIRSNESDLHITRGHGYGVTLNLFNNDFDDDADFDNPSSGDLRIEDTSDYHHGGNIKSDPLFVDVDSQNFHLQPDSPCIDAGNDGAPSLPSKDYDGRDRIIGPHVDMGPYEEDDVDIEVSKSDSQDPVSPGDTLTYTITVKNNGPSTALDVSVSDNIPLEILNPQYSTDGGNTWNDWSGSLTIGDMSSGDTYTFLIRGTVDPTIGATTTINNTASANANTHDYNPDNSSDTESTLIRVLADLSITKSDNPDPVVAGSSTLTYTINVSNGGPNYASDVVLNDDIPQEVENPEYSTDGGSTWNVWSGSLNLGTLSNGSSRTILIRGTVSPWAIGTISNSASISSNADDNNTSNNSATESTTINTSADLSITKSDGSDPVVAGNTLTYTIRVNNNGPSYARNVVVSDNLPSSIQNPEYSTDGGSTWNVWSGSLNLGTLSNGSGRTILIRGIVSSSATGSISNTATVSSDTSDPNTSNNSATENTTINTSADLSITKSDDPDPVIAGNELTYTIRVLNDGPSDARNVVVSDNLPSSIQNPEYSTDGGSSWNTWNGSLNLGTLSNGGSYQLLIRGTISPSATGSISNTASVSSDTSDPNTSNNSATEDTTINTSADLSITKTDDPDPVIAGNELTYTIRVLNDGPSDARNVVVSDNLPSSIENPEYSTDGGTTWNTWGGSLNLGTVESGKSSEILIKGKVSSSTTGSLSNTASVSSDTDDPDTSNNSTTESTTVNTSADLSITKTDDPDPVIAGNELTYTIRVLNDGPSDARNVVVSDNLPSSIQNPEYSTDGGTTWNTWGGSLNLETVESGKSSEILIKGKVSSSTTGSLSNTASVSSDTDDPDTSNNSTTENTTVNTSSDLSITKTDDPDPVIAGNELTYTITVSNGGPSDSRNVVVSDTIPSNLQNPEYSLDGGSTWNSWSGSLNLGTISSGENREILIRGVVDLSTQHNFHIENRATVSSDTDDPDTSNNEGSADTRVINITDLEIREEIDSQNYSVGDEINFTITLTNHGPQRAFNTVVRDLLIPGVFTYISSVATRGSYDSGSGIWNVGDMDSGESDTLIIRARVEKEGEYKNVCYAETTTKDSDYSNNSSMVFINRSDFVDIGVYVASDVSDVNGGDSFWYHVYVRNFGNEKTNGVRISDVFPGNLLELIDFNASKGSYDNNSGIWDIGELLPGDFAELDLNVRANPNEENGEIIYETHLESLDGEDVNNLNNYSSAIVNKEESRVDISVDKVKGGDIYSGYEGYFVISVRNLGPDDATGVVINDVLPDELGYISSTATSGSYDSTSGNWNVGDLSSGDVAILLIEIVGNANGNFTNKAEVSGVNEEDIDLRNNSDECVMKVSGVDAKIEVSVDDRCPYAGEPISIHFKVLNDNPAAIKYAKVETGIPSEMKIISVSGDGTFNEISREWILSNVLPDESATLNVRCYQNEETDHSNGRHKYTAKIVEIIPIDTDESNNVCEYLILLDKKSNSDVYINTSIDNKIPRVGDVVGMHFQVGNSGPDPVYSLSGYIFLNGAVDFRGGGGYGVILNYPEFFIPELMAGESVGFTVNIIPLEERDYFYYGELTTDLINDGNLRNNEAPGRFSTRRIYHFIPGGNGIGGSNGSKLDIDGDNKLSVVDLYKLLNVIVGNIIPQEKSKYDLNEDGKIDEKDALILRIYLSGEVY